MRKYVNNQKPKRRHWSHDDIAHIQHLSMMGASNSAIAREFDTNPSQVSKLKHRGVHVK